MPSEAESRNDRAKLCHTFVELGNGHKLTRLVGDRHIARPKDDGFRSRFAEVRGLRTEGNRCGRAAGDGLHQSGEFAGGSRLKGLVDPLDIQPGFKARSALCQLRQMMLNEFRSERRTLTGNEPPLDGDAAFAWNDVLGSASMNQTDIQGGERWIEG